MAGAGAGVGGWARSPVQGRGHTPELGGSRWLPRTGGSASAEPRWRRRESSRRVAGTAAQPCPFPNTHAHWVLFRLLNASP